MRLEGWEVEACPACGELAVPARHLQTGELRMVNLREIDGGTVALWPDDETGDAVFAVPMPGALGGPLRTFHGCQV